MPQVHRIATEIQITSICAGFSPNLSIMRDELGAMQARRGQQFFASHHRAIRHVMHISLAAISEAKGMLLSDRNILIAESARRCPHRADPQTKIDEQLKTSSYEPTKNELQIGLPQSRSLGSRQ